MTEPSTPYEPPKVEEIDGEEAVSTVPGSSIN
jgi:hypothetical protein